MTDEMMSDMTAYQKWEHAKLEDIDHDTDALIKMLGDEKMGESYDSGVLAGMLSQKGIDPGILAMLNNNDGFGHGGGLLFLLFLVILMGGNGFGWGNNNRGDMGLDRTIINEGNFNQMMAAVTQSGQAQTAAVQALANNLNTDVMQITQALAAMDKEIAINRGDIKSAIQSCCCNIRTEMQAQSNAIQLGTERGLNGVQRSIGDLGQSMANAFATAGYQNQQLFNDQNTLITKAFCDQNAYLAEQFCLIRNREDQREIQQLRDQLAQQRSTANTQAILTAIQNKDTIAATIQGTLDTTAGTWSGSGTGTLS